MTAQGTLQSPVNVLDENGTQSSVDEVRWNTQTWDFAMKHAAGEGRNRMAILKAVLESQIFPPRRRERVKGVGVRELFSFSVFRRNAN